MRRRASELDSKPVSALQIASRVRRFYLLHEAPDLRYGVLLILGELASGKLLQ